MQLIKCVLSVALAWAVLPAQANLINNGDFEGDVQADGTYSNFVSLAGGWTGNAYLMNPSPTGGFPGGTIWPQAFGGSNYLDIGNTAGGGISQSFTVAAAGTFKVQWADHTAAVPGFTAPYTVTLSGGAYSDSFLAYHASGQWVVQSALVNLAAGNYSLSFTPTGTVGSLDVLIDGVSVNAVPEPQAYALALVALGGLGALSRRARRG